MEKQNSWKQRIVTVKLQIVQNEHQSMKWICCAVVSIGECSCKTVSLEDLQINMLWKINQGELLERFEEYQEDSP